MVEWGEKAQKAHHQGYGIENSWISCYQIILGMVIAMETIMKISS